MDIVAENKLFPSFKELMQMCLTFGLTVFAWIFFRSDNVMDAFHYISRIFSKSLFGIPLYSFDETGSAVPIFVLVCFFIIIEWLGRREQYAIARLFHSSPKFVKVAWFYFLVILIFIFTGSNQQFIYFQF